MADDADITDEREAKELAARIEIARRVIPIHERPILGCIDCRDMTQNRAKETCTDYADCLADWEKEQRMQRINGKGE